ncbi:GNAT family N-acetyltransferase [Staphylococcus simulans]|uniref:GNAT family N-acetyltransferase n=1 Tax=Staphylococcus simulans TaxID=1286 RepID=UPI000D1F6DC5|nr:GNAT family N-acetyltransferase [Staphylococcus simulans]PTJ27698.1 GNAT family N-acetyltransferase [Staphylococcus simulans]VED60308.1 putative acetyltransferase [Staphylococcus simulans]
MIRNASQEDLNAVAALTEEAKKIMAEDNNPQWDEAYPLLEHFEEDITNKSLFVLEEENTIYGYIVIDQNQSKWYDELEWPIDRTNAYVIHRFAGSANYKGAATALFNFAVERALDHGVDVLLTDTYAANQRAQNLFEKFGFHKAGEANLNYPPYDKEESFYAYYRILK